MILSRVRLAQEIFIIIAAKTIDRDDYDSWSNVYDECLEIADSFGEAYFNKLETDY